MGTSLSYNLGRIHVFTVVGGRPAFRADDFFFLVLKGLCLDQREVMLAMGWTFLIGFVR